MAYIRLSLALHGLEDNVDEESVVKELKYVLNSHFDFTRDIEIEIEEHAGVTCHNEDKEHK